MEIINETIFMAIVIMLNILGHKHNWAKISRQIFLQTMVIGGVIIGVITLISTVVTVWKWM